MDLMIREMMKVPGWPASDIAVFRSYREAMGWLAVDVLENDENVEDDEDAETDTPLATILDNQDKEGPDD
jgi:hypothetical protein